MVPDPPLPILGRRFPGPARIEVTFDQQLQPGPVSHANWRWRWASIDKVGQAPATVLGNTVTISENSLAADLGPNECWYDAFIPDIVNLFGTPAAAFANFPLT